MVNTLVNVKEDLDKAVGWIYKLAAAFRSPQKAAIIQVYADSLAHDAFQPGTAMTVGLATMEPVGTVQGRTLQDQ